MEQLSLTIYHLTQNRRLMPIEIQDMVRERKQVAILNLSIEIQALIRERKQMALLNLWIEIQALVRERKQVAY